MTYATLFIIALYIISWATFPTFDRDADDQILNRNNRSLLGSEANAIGSE